MTSRYVSLTNGRMHYLEAGAGPAIRIRTSFGT